MNLTVIVVGVLVLVGLAAVIGLIQSGDGSARDRAWRRIAAARRHNREERQRIMGLRDELDGCRDCAFRTPRPEQPDR